jgi:hypothetical protein
MHESKAQHQGQFAFTTKTAGEYQACFSTHGASVCLGAASKHAQQWWDVSWCCKRGLPKNVSCRSTASLFKPAAGHASACDAVSTI